MADIHVISTSSVSPRYWLPSIITTLTLWFGLAAVWLATCHEVRLAVYAVLAALLADNLDGRIARLTGSTSVFGKEYDSLSDMVAFGVAPAFMLADACQGDAAGWLAGVVYVTCAALRLARFNSLPAYTDDETFFIGLPSPIGACTVAGFVSLLPDISVSVGFALWSVLMLGFVAGGLMVSSIRFLSIKSVSRRSGLYVLTSLFILAVVCSAFGRFGWFFIISLAVYFVGSLFLSLQTGGNE